jgi:hypothetical protein
MTTPTDNRELILARVEALLKTAMPGVHVYRNRLRIPDEKLPAVAILDGDEMPDDSGYGRGRPANAPIVVTMRPEIYAFTNEPDDKVGPALNVLRKAVMKAILNDATLLGLCKDKDVRYEGFSTGLAQGRSLEGEMAIAFAFVYVLRPASL